MRINCCGIAFKQPNAKAAQFSIRTIFLIFIFLSKLKEKNVVFYKLNLLSSAIHFTIVVQGVFRTTGLYVRETNLMFSNTIVNFCWRLRNHVVWSPNFDGQATINPGLHQIDESWSSLYVTIHVIIRKLINHCNLDRLYNINLYIWHFPSRHIWPPSKLRDLRDKVTSYNSSTWRDKITDGVVSAPNSRIIKLPSG